MFSFLCLKDIWKHSMVWNVFFKNIATFDCELETLTSILEESVWKCYLQFSIGSISVVFIYLLSYDIVTGYAVWISLIFWNVVNLQILVIPLILQIIFRIAEKRFEILLQKTVEVYSSRNVCQTFWSGLHLKNAHFLLITITGGVNKLFGQKILLLFILTFFYVLTVFQYLILEELTHIDRNINVVFSLAVQTLMALVSIELIFQIAIWRILVAFNTFKCSLSLWGGLRWYLGNRSLHAFGKKLSTANRK